MGIVGQRELVTQGLLIELVFLFERKSIGSEKARRCETVQRCGDRYGEDIHFMMTEGMQGTQALRNQILMR